MPLTRSKRFLYRTWGASVIGILVFFVLSLPSFGQEPRPQITPRKNLPQENKKPKKGKDPRAVGILQLSGGKGTLIPVAILIDGKFYDASAYKADPVPMALDVGTVYEAEQAGDSQGLFTINGALHTKDVGRVNPWVGTGTFLPKGAEAPKTTRKAEDVPVGLDNSGDEPPRLTRKGSATGGGGSSPGSASAPPASAPPGDKNSDPGAKPAKPADNGSSTSNPAAGGQSSASQTTQSPTNAGSPSPTQTSSNQTPTPAPGASGPTSSIPTSSTPASSGSASDDNYYRPTLRRGKPTTSAPADEDESAKKKDPKKSLESAGAVAAGATQVAASMQSIAAISDAAGPDPQSYKIYWKTGEEEERHKQMVALAGLEVRTYAAALAKNQILARATPVKTAPGRKTSAKPSVPELENAQFRAFDVWVTGQPVMIFTADAKIPAASGASNVPVDSYSVTVVARTDIYGNLQKLYSGVTDRFHLDVTPRLELIDVVDADADGRGELLFRETTDTGTGYVIYRATADKLWKMFDSLNAE